MLRDQGKQVVGRHFYAAWKGKEYFQWSSWASRLSLAHKPNYTTITSKARGEENQNTRGDEIKGHGEQWNTPDHHRKFHQNVFNLHYANVPIWIGTEIFCPCRRVCVIEYRRGSSVCDDNLYTDPTWVSCGLRCFWCDSIPRPIALLASSSHPISFVTLLIDCCNPNSNCFFLRCISRNPVSTLRKRLAVDSVKFKKCQIVLVWWR